MKISQHLHHRIRLKNLLLTFVLLSVIGILGWLSARYSVQSDWTANSRNTLSEASVKLVHTLPDEIQISAYIDKNKLMYKKITQLVDRYRQFKPDITLDFVNRETHLKKVRELAIGPEGAIIVEYQGRMEQLSVLNEATLTNSLLKLANADERWISVLTGHAERSPIDSANHDLSIFAKELARRNITVVPVNLAKLGAIPDNTSVLVIAGPTVALLSEEIEIILQYVQQGGNLLWLTDPGNNFLMALADLLGVAFLPGTIVNGSSQIYGIDDPSFVVISSYYQHPVTRNQQTMSVYPVAAALEMDQESDYQGSPLLTSAPRSWTETGPISGTVRFDADGEEQEGPLDIALALTRAYARDKQQRIIVVGDGDFLSNAYISNVGNMGMGLRMIDWLSHADDYIDIQPKSAHGQQLLFSKIAIAVIGFGFLLVLPLCLLATGFFIWRKRKTS